MKSAEEEESSVFLNEGKLSLGFFVDKLYIGDEQVKLLDSDERTELNEVPLSDAKELSNDK